MRPPALFDSWFEVDVFLRIARRRYRVIPQFEVAGYRIDLVVQGMDGSLAVECDGDAWHGADRHEADAARQRDLERCGWTFWRVRESVFRLDPDEALSNLWETLKTQRILPTTTEDTPRQEPRQHNEPLPVRDDRPAGRERSIGVQVQRDAAIAGGDREPARFADQLRGNPSDLQSTDRTAESDSSTQVTEATDAPDHPPCRERIVPHQQMLRLPGRNLRPRIQAGRVDGLAPYAEWTSRGATPDPRTASQVELAMLLAEVTRREGPVVALRAYRLINRASGSQRLTAPARRTLNRACAAAVRTGDVVAANPLHREGQAQLVLRSPESPEVVLRARGPRELDELPPDEVAMMLRVLCEAGGSVEALALKRQALDRLGWVRLTRNVNEFLDQCIALM